MDYEPGKYNVETKLTRRGNAEAALTLSQDGKNGSLRLFLGTATVFDTSTRPPRTYTEPPRVVNLAKTQP
jgi:hypothetical protein